MYWFYIGRMGQKVEITFMGYIGTTIRVHPQTTVSTLCEAIPNRPQRPRRPSEPRKGFRV